jgi:CspA family cold shock protein
MSEGHIKWYNEKKGYGIIQTDEQSDIFFSKCNIENHGFWKPLNSERVSFDILETRRGKQADRVKPGVT